MSPEQAKGRAVDRRSDVWAFGAVLYEMLTGTRAFPGEDVSEVLASVLAREPDWARLPAALSPALAIYIRRCLDKNPKQRIGDVQDVRLALEGAFETAAPPVTSPSMPIVKARRPWAWMATAALLALAAPLAWFLKPSPQAVEPVLRVELALPDGVAPLRGAVRTRSGSVGRWRCSRCRAFLALGPLTTSRPMDSASSSLNLWPRRQVNGRRP